MKVMLVPGTWSFDALWWQAGYSWNFAAAVQTAGHELINGRPFIWDTELGGFGFGRDELWGWEAAGWHLWDYLEPRCCTNYNPEETVIIAHSHARQVVKFACERGLKVGKVIFVSGPVRKDVDDLTKRARNNIGKIICLNGGKKDRLQWLGEIFDGRFGRVRRDPQADAWYTHADADHGSFLNKPEHFDYVLRHI